ncbi:hypothetical protein FACS1894188_12820 [Clostridia bacterium]|nr:hypothetical protein FACS1894188_12820 [Clostridia bacterium]
MKSELDKLNIKITDEHQGFSAPEWTEETIKEIEQDYKPTAITWREKVRIDIDTLIYRVSSLDELLEALRKQGYANKVTR